MTKSEMMPWLVKWSEKIQAADDALDSMQKLFDGDFESPALKPICDTMDLCTEAISYIVGDECEWLDYYRRECQMGRHPLTVKYDGLEKQMDSIEVLADVVSR